MQTTTNDLQAAFNRSTLPALGYSFETAMQNRGFVICLQHLAEAKPKKTEIRPAKTYWYHNI